MNALTVRVNTKINSFPLEYRIPIVNALRCSDGTYLSFHSELLVATWDFPDLPVDQIIEEICWDVA
jgi:hypothetical protein